MLCSEVNIREKEKKKKEKNINEGFFLSLEYCLFA